MIIADRYDIDALRKELKTLEYELFYFPKIDSTMQIIETHALEGEGKQIIALTDHQIQGVGRKGRKWLDTPYSSLMFSGLFYIRESSIASFADIVALTLCQTLRRTIGVSSIQIKYPNDLVFDDKKLGGILVKNIYDEKLRYKGTSLGVGINVHYNLNELHKFPTDYPATSLDICTGAFVQRQNLFVEIMRALRYLGTETEVIEANSQARASFEEKWREAASMLGRKITILKYDKVIEEGIVIDVGIGRGIELQTKKAKKWFSLFETDMKARIVN
jgi:BirA family biotin operon repressor/biotin-[acetyl-CoA-carboxylase] ligase